MKINKLKNLIREQINLLKEQNNTFTMQTFKYCWEGGNSFTLAFDYDTVTSTAPVESQTQLQQQFYEAMGSPSVGGQTYFWGSGCLEYLGSTDLTSDTDSFGINDYPDTPMYGFPDIPDFLTYTEPYLFDTCEQCMGSCISMVAESGLPSMFDFCAKCDYYGGVYDDTTIDLYHDCCDICDDSYQKYKCAASGGGISATYEQSCIATWESDAPFNTLEECQTSGCGQMDLVGPDPGPAGPFSCPDFLEWEGTGLFATIQTGEGMTTQELICSIWCNQYGAPVGGLMTQYLDEIPNFSWEFNEDWVFFDSWFGIPFADPNPNTGLPYEYAPCTNCAKYRSFDSSAGGSFGRISGG